MKISKFSKEKPTEPGWYLCQYNVFGRKEIMLIEITNDDMSCDECNDNSKSTCKKCNDEGYIKVLNVNHPTYYNLCESESLDNFHSAGPYAKKSQKKIPDLWSERIDVGE